MITVRKPGGEDTPDVVRSRRGPWFIAVAPYGTGSLPFILLAFGRTALGQAASLPAPLAPPVIPPLPTDNIPEPAFREVVQAQRPVGVPIDLPTALNLAGATPLDIAAASAQVDQARGLLIQARALWIPNLNGGIGYYRHDGTNQNLFTGAVFQKSTNTIQLGGGPSMSVSLADAVFAPRTAKRVVASRNADVQTTRNNVLNTVAAAYFNVQESRGRIAGAEAAIIRAERLVQFAIGLAPALIAPLEINRAKAELENLLQYREVAIRDWRVNSAQLAEILLLDPSTLLEPVETPFFQLALIPAETVVDDLVPVALRNRPEIASQRELLAAAEQTLKREKYRPLLPNIIITSPSTANAGVLPAGEIYGGHNALGGQGGRDDFTVAAYWQLQNGGIGNIGLIRQRRAERNIASIEVTRTLFHVRSDVSQSLSRVQTSRNRVPQSDQELRQAIESADKNFLGLRETTRPAGELLTLVIRPQEVVAAIQELNVAFQNYASAINDFNRAQFDLYRSLGEPAQWVTSLNRKVQPIPNAIPVAPAPPPLFPPK